MNNQDLLDAMSGVRDRYIQDAMQTKAPSAVPGRRLPRAVLIAAVIALTMILVGCVAVFLGLQERKVGQYTYTQKYDDQGMAAEPTEKTMAVAAMTGSQDSPAHQAAREWWEFTSTYDPGELGNDSDLADIPNNYEYTYQCRTPEMVETLDSIAQKYGLQLLDTMVVVQREQKDLAMEALGVYSLFREEAGVEADYGAFLICPPENFTAHLNFSLPEADGEFTQDIYAEVSYLRNDYIAQSNSYLTYDPENSTQWEYTTAGGSRVLLVLTSNPGSYTFEGKILVETEEATFVAELDLVESLFLEEDTPLPTQRDLELLADCFDYTIGPQSMDADALAQEVRAAEEAYRESEEQRAAEYAAQIPVYADYGAYIDANFFFPETQYYAFYDLDDDGSEEVYIGTADGVCDRWLDLRDGAVQSIAEGGLRLCQGRILEYKDPVFENYIYYRLTEANDPEAFGLDWTIQQTVSYREGSWSMDGSPCTQEEAEAAIAAYVPVELDLRPLTEFPMEDGGTLGQVVETEGTPTRDELLTAYAGYVSQFQTDPPVTCFALEDINEDGIDDLLLSSDGELIRIALTYKRETVVELIYDFYLCQGNVAERATRRETYAEGITEARYFYKLDGNRHVCQDYLWHSVSDGSWRWNSEGAVSEAEAQAILDRYPRTTPDFRPIDELTGR